MSRAKILLIEQNSQTLRTLGDVLKEADFYVLAATRALEGLDAARKYSPDIIITALSLPDMSGREIATTLRTDHLFTSTPIVVLLEADTSVEQRELCLVAGVTGFIKHPLNTKIILLQVELYLSGGQESVGDDDRLDAAQTRYMKEFVSNLEDRIRALETKNSELQRLDQIKDTFIQLTAHELRTPLTLITGYSGLLEDYPQLQEMIQNDETISTVIGGLSESITRMRGIIEEILIVSRIMTNNIELDIVPTNLASLIQRVIQQYQPTYEERQLNVVWDKRQWAISMRLDAELLEITINNLMSNAIKYTPNHGTIYVTAQHTRSLLRFSIRDTGIGIDPSNHETIFERFHIGGDINLHSTSKTAFGGGGLGLGLAICKGIVTAHGGKIWVESEKQDEETFPGSEFIVVLPIDNHAKKSSIKRLQE